MSIVFPSSPTNGQLFSSSGRNFVYTDPPGVWESVDTESLPPPGSPTWINYAVGFTVLPTFLETVAAGDVWEYTYSFGTLYRVIGPTDDEFYQNYTSPTPSDLVAKKSI